MIALRSEQERLMERLLQDLRYALRTLRRTPGFTTAAVLTLALGIGATTAIFSVVDGVLLRPLPYGGAERIVTLWQHDRAHGVERDDVSAANFLDWRERSRSFSDISAIEPFGLDYLGPDGPLYINTWRVTEGFFRILDTPALLGRTFVSEDFTSETRAVVLSHGLWQRLFGGDRAIVGRTLTLDEAPAVVVGVMPPTFDLPAGSELWDARSFGEAARQSRAANYFSVLARLRPGVTVEQARAEMEAIGAQVAREYPDVNAEVGITLVPLEELLIGPVRPALLVLLGAVSFVLLIACANVANLLLARGTARRRDFAIRAALGGGRWRLLRQFLTESLLLALLGGAGGVLLAYWGLDAIVASAPAELPRIGEVALDARVLAFTLGVSLLTALLFGLGPALQSLRLDLRSFLAEGGRAATAGGKRRRLRDLIVVGEVALALVLLAGAGLVVRSFLALLDVDRGFRTENVLAVTLQAWQYFPEEAQRALFVREAIDRLEALPQVRAAGMTSSLPLGEPIYAENATFTIEGRRPAGPGQEPSARAAVASAGFFRTLDIPLRKGRLFEPTDVGDAPWVALINAEMARRFWPDEDPVGKSIVLTFAGPPRSTEIVGVVGNVRHEGLDREPQPTVYVPHAQKPTGAITFTLRTTGDPATVLGAVQQVLWSFHGSMPIASTSTLEGLLSDSLRERRFYLLLLSGFSLVALLLAAVGIYGVISYLVRQRAQEIGIRMALGASAADILRLTLRRGVLLTAGGVGLGLLGALALTRLLQGLLFGVEPTDPLTFAAVSLLLAAVAILASFLPARRAARVDPMVALRAE